MNGNAWRRLAAAVALACAAAAGADVVDDALAGRVGAGTPEAGIEAIEAVLDRDPGDDRALFALGVLRTVRGWETLAQAVHRFGAGNGGRGPAMFVMPGLSVIPYNDEPEPVSVEDLRRAILSAMEQIELADRALARIDGDFVARADLMALRCDLDEDGTAGERETIGALLRAFGARLRTADGTEEARELVVAFDRGDAEWLRGYCHLELALAEFILAHEWDRVFELTGHAFFPASRTEHEYLKGPRSPFGGVRQTTGVDPIDLVAFLHLLNLPVDEPKRMRAAREHLLAATRHSRAMWAHYNAETDDDAEWIPNPDQRALFPGVRVTREDQEAWGVFLDDIEDVLEGEKLLPFWRGDGLRGVNVRRVLEKPRAFDLVLWIQGSAAAPYLEEGEQVNSDAWEGVRRAFEGHTFAHIVWFN